MSTQKVLDVVQVFFTSTYWLSPSSYRFETEAQPLRRAPC